MASKGCIIIVSKALIAVIAFTTSGCTLSKEMNGKFPLFPVVAPIDVFKLGTIPAQKICTISESKSSKEFVVMLSKRYPEGWRKSSHVSLAPSYRILTGTTEILVLKQGIAISVAKGEKERYVVVHGSNEDEAEALVSIACEVARKAK